MDDTLTFIVHLLLVIMAAICAVIGLTIDSLDPAERFACFFLAAIAMIIVSLHLL